MELTFALGFLRILFSFQRAFRERLSKSEDFYFQAIFLRIFFTYRLLLFLRRRREIGLYGFEFFSSTRLLNFLKRILSIYGASFRLNARFWFLTFIGNVEGIASLV